MQSNIDGDDSEKNFVNKSKVDDQMKSAGEIMGSVPETLLD